MALDCVERSEDCLCEGGYDCYVQLIVQCFGGEGWCDTSIDSFNHKQCVMFEWLLPLNANHLLICSYFLQLVRKH